MLSNPFSRRASLFSIPIGVGIRGLKVTNNGFKLNSFLSFKAIAEESLPPDHGTIQ